MNRERPIGSEAWHPRLGKVVVVSELLPTIGGGPYVRVKAEGRTLPVDVPEWSLRGDPTDEPPVVR